MDCFRDSGKEDVSSEHITMHVGTLGMEVPEVCIAYNPPAESEPGEDGVINIPKNNSIQFKTKHIFRE